MENQTVQSEKPIHSIVFDRQMRIEGWNQDALSEQVVLCLGVGGLGSCVTINLVRLGVKKVILVDYDKVDTHNLNRQILFSKEDVGKSKVEQAMKNLEMHNVGGTIVEGYDIDAVKCWNKIVKLAEECTAVFNMIDWGENFDVAVQSLCLNLKIPFIMGGTFSASLSVDAFSGKGKPCFLCVTDGIKKEIIEKLMPEKIKEYENIDFIPKDNNPVGQSNVFLCSTCSNFMTSMFINHVFNDPTIQAPKRVLFYVNSFESVTFPADINPNCPFCNSLEGGKEEKAEEVEKESKERKEEKEETNKEESGEKEEKEDKKETGEIENKEEKGEIEEKD